MSHPFGAIALAVGLVFDNFAGGGGASTGIEQAFGFSPHHALNHSPPAIAIHRANHATTTHHCQNINLVDPRDLAQGNPVAYAHFSPDCKDFSIAKGGRPKRKHIRDLAWNIPKWARLVRPTVITMENVREFRQWCELDDDGNPAHPEDALQLDMFKAAAPKKVAKRGPKAPDGPTFLRWKAELQKLGYVVEMRELRGCDYGDPTTRLRLFIVMRCDGNPIVWPEPTHGAPGSHEVLSGKLLPFKTAGEHVIDWTINCPSIFGRKKDLEPATKRRIAKGFVKFVLENPRPFIINVCHTKSGDRAGHDTLAPMPTVTTARGGEFALVTPVLERAEKVAAFITQNNAGFYTGAGNPADAPLSTITASGTQQSLITAHLVKLRNNCYGQALDGPMDAVCAGGTHFGVVAAFLVKYYGAGVGQRPDRPLDAVTSVARFGLVTVQIDGESWVVVDIGFRMLTPRELARAQGWPETYILDPVCEYTTKSGRKKTGPLPIATQIYAIGNGVNPGPMRAIAGANNPFKSTPRRASAALNDNNARRYRSAVA